MQMFNYRRQQHLKHRRSPFKTAATALVGVGNHCVAGWCCGNGIVARAKPAKNAKGVYGTPKRPVPKHILAAF